MHREHWHFREQWLEYVLKSWDGVDRVKLVDDPSPARLTFRDRAERAFRDAGVPVRFVKTYVSVQVPESGDGYAKDYPHVHYPQDATTLVHYLQPGDVPAELDIFEGGEVVDTITPERGLTVFIPHTVRHGVRKNHGTTNRVQFIATALP